MKKNIIETIGWVGTVATLSAYFLVSFGYLSAFSIVFQAINLIGAIGLIIIGFYKKAYQPAIVDVVWFLIASIAIFQILFK